MSQQEGSNFGPGYEAFKRGARYAREQDELDHDDRSAVQAWRDVDDIAVANERDKAARRWSAEESDPFGGERSDNPVPPQAAPPHGEGLFAGQEDDAGHSGVVGR